MISEEAFFHCTHGKCCRRFRTTSSKDKMRMVRTQPCRCKHAFTLFPEKYATRQITCTLCSGALKLRSPKAPAPIIHPKFGYMHAELFVFEFIPDKNFGASPHLHTLDQLNFQVCELSRFFPDVLSKLKQPRLLNLRQILLAVMSSDKPLPFIYQFAAGKLLPLCTVAN